MLSEDTGVGERKVAFWNLIHPQPNRLHIHRVCNTFCKGEFVRNTPKRDRSVSATTAENIGCRFKVTESLTNETSYQLGDTLRSSWQCLMRLLGLEMYRPCTRIIKG